MYTMRMTRSQWIQSRMPATRPVKKKRPIGSGRSINVYVANSGEKIYAFTKGEARARLKEELGINAKHRLPLGITLNEVS